MPIVRQMAHYRNVLLTSHLRRYSSYLRGTAVAMQFRRGVVTRNRSSVRIMGLDAACVLWGSWTTKR
ncbi:hypothetical protein SBA5_20016 [Candidatus Sulfotelmatomonas gaucii]|uniref:Uncharacterized protein n=1 Tax=Candidatus Sulfuritelmatomonas gaucii TaxID=2043161 RepID=A0A2N9L718_9BACT|nr:hypothetical protein SBA5_20016 [Candidatus Sulfotelmatomonas gaucii]